MAHSNEKKSKSLPETDIKKSTKSALPKSKTRIDPASDGHFEAHQKASNSTSTYFLDHSMIYSHGHPTSFQPRQEDDPAAATWPRLETRGYDWYSQTRSGGHGVVETNTYQLQQWAYDTSNSNLTFAERLEKSKWEEVQEQ